jgi:hypothetical protein
MGPKQLYLQTKIQKLKKKGPLENTKHALKRLLLTVNKLKSHRRSWALEPPTTQDFIQSLD